MHSAVSRRRARREFLRFLAASPLAALAPAAEPNATPISDPKQALNLMDFEAAARKALPPAHYGYLMTGVEDDRTVAENSKAFERIRLRLGFRSRAQVAAWYAAQRDRPASAK